MTDPDPRQFQPYPDYGMYVEALKQAEREATKQAHARLFDLRQLTPIDHHLCWDERERREYLAKYPTRWSRFLHWIGWRQ